LINAYSLSPSTGKECVQKTPKKEEELVDFWVLKEGG
jgi:hypothetical protein